jgi:pimeloyl-ACP methyl ester carboxylesterase
MGRGTLAAKALAEGASVVADAFLPRLLGASTTATRPELAAALRERIVATSAEGLANGLLGLGLRRDSTPTLGTLRVPTLVLCGEEDVVTPPAESEALHRGIAGSRLVLIPRAGHLAAVEQPEAVGNELSELVRSLY